MSIFDRFRRKPETRAAETIDINLASFDIFQNPYIYVNATAESCMRKIVSTLAGLNLSLYVHRKGGGRALMAGHPLFEALKNPAPSITPTLFYSQIHEDILHGNAYLLVQRLAGQIFFSRLIPQEVHITIENGRKIFYHGMDIYTEKNILHIPYPFDYNSKTGLGRGPEDKYRELIALDNMLTAYIKMYFGNSVGKRSVLELDKDKWNEKKMDEVYAILAPAVQKFVLGAGNAGKVMIPPPGTKLSVHDTTQNLYTDLKSLKELIERQISQGFGVLYSLISEQNKYDSLEANQLQFLADTIEPLGTHVEQSFNRLLSPAETAMYCKYDYKAMLQSDVKTTVEYLAKEVGAGLLTINEARDKLDLSAVDAGDYTFVPANLWPLTVDNVDAFFAQSKLATHNSAGDDKQ